jgi:hypothetical protein
MLLEVSVSPKKTIFFKYNRHLILIRLQQTYMEILIVISSMLKYLLKYILSLCPSYLKHLYLIPFPQAIRE